MHGRITHSSMCVFCVCVFWPWRSTVHSVSVSRDVLILGEESCRLFYFPSVNPVMLEGKKNIQSLTSRSSPCQNDLGVCGGGGPLGSRGPRRLVSSVARRLSSLYPRAHVWTLFLFVSLVSYFCLVLFFVCFLISLLWCWCVLLCCRVRDCDSAGCHLLCVGVSVLFMCNQLCTIFRLN